MEIISDTTGADGRRHVVARFTADERAAMARRAAAHRAEIEARRAVIEAARKAKREGE